jgi:hypothetical protein
LACDDYQSVYRRGCIPSFRSFFGFSQTLWFSFATSVATRRSRMATSVWLEITFQIGMGIAAFGGRPIDYSRRFSACWGSFPQFQWLFAFPDL